MKGADIGADKRTSWTSRPTNGAIRGIENENIDRNIIYYQQ
jgi:hypothetical protein